MIQGIQNVSFSGTQSMAAKYAKGKAAKAVKVVTAATDLSGSANIKEARKLRHNARLFNDTNTMSERVDSYKAARQTIASQDINDKEAKIFKDQNTMQERVDSFQAARQPITIDPTVVPTRVIVEAKPAAPIIPEQSINYFG